MSLEVNTAFLERVAEFIDECEGMATIPATAESMLEAQNYEGLEAYMNQVNASLSQEHFAEIDAQKQDDRNWEFEMDATDAY